MSMSELQKTIQNAVKNNIEIIESERYNSKDPMVTIGKDDPTEQIIIKLLTSERTGAPLKYGMETLNPAEDLANKNFNNGIRSLNSWQFRSSDNYFNEAAKTARDLKLQQRINLYKQLHNLLKSVIQTSPDRIVKSKGAIFEEVAKLIAKYDKLDATEQNYYRKQVDSLYELAHQLNDGEREIRTNHLLAKCSISLYNQEYLAAYVWLYKIYLLNKEMFDTIAEGDDVLRKALKTLRQYLESETGLKEIEDLPTMASAFDLQMIFIDHLSAIYDVEFLVETKMKFSFPVYRENK
ncbi:MAG: hypothetical protein JJE41_12960 [Candidatus Heimdallarchaeota archaeon]|nr:hypothetical protein [Candidatus Heimdallarchaeota archaeon]